MRRFATLLAGLLVVQLAGSAEGVSAEKKPAKPAAAHKASQKSSKKSSSLPALLQEVEAKYAKASTLEADFVQVNEVATLQQKKTSSGVILFKRPNKIRWETTKPDPNVLVSDGRKFWYYTPPFDEGEHGQLIERRSSQVQSKLAQALLSGSFSATRDLRVEKGKDSSFNLFPKKGTAGTVVKARIEIDPAEKLITSVTLEHSDGNRSEIKLSKIQLGKEIEDRLFQFVAPPGTDLVKE